MPYPFQILQTHNNDILMAYEYASASRVIKMGKTEPPPVDTWMGQSTGRWDGDTLVVDTIGFKDQTWFDRAGNFHSEALHVTERFTRKSPDVLLPGDDRGSESVHTPLEDSNASLPQTGSERAVDGVQVRRVRRGADVRTLTQEDGRRETVRRRAYAVAVACASRIGRS